MSISIRKTILGSAALVLSMMTALPVVAIAKTATPAHKVVKHTAMAHKKVVGNAHVKAIQAALDKAGAKLKADGVMGPRTKAALKAYQSKKGLKATGTANKATLKSLGVK